MRASKAKTEIRQQQIARAATRLLAKRGWEQVSLAGIAKAVGVVPSAVYRHFSGKDQVLDAVLDLVAQSFQTNLQAARDTADGSRPSTRRIWVRLPRLSGTARTRTSSGASWPLTPSR